MTSREVVVSTLMSEHGGSGVQSHVRTFREYLDSLDYPVSVVDPFSSRSVLVLPVFAVRRAIQPISRSSSVWWYRRWHAHYLEGALRAHLATTDGNGVLYAQCPVSADVALRVRRTEPVVLAAHFNVSQADEWADKNQISRDGKLFASIRALEARVLPRLDGIVYVSNFTKSVLQERIPDLYRVSDAIVPNCVHPSKDQDRRHIGDLITVGGLEPRKNQAYLLKVLAVAAARGHRYTLTIVGDGPDRAALEALSRRLGLAQQVTFLRHQHDPRSLMRGHKIYCHTARMESFGIVLVEAMSEGLPVLAGAVGGIPEVIRPGLDGQFWPLDDAAAAADTLIRIMTEPARREAMSASGRRRATDTFAPDLVESRLLDFLNDVSINRTVATH
jgi:glycosyltransferase involved in cell wall biosynthesis